MYLGYRQYQLHFDLAGLCILFVALIVLGALVVQVYRGRLARSAAIAAVLLSICTLQFYRGWMVPSSAWLTMLGSVESSNAKERSRMVEELRTFWNTDTETMRSADWYTLAAQWNVCHTMWVQSNCLNPKPSEPAVGVAREILNDMVIQNRRSSGAR